MYCLSWNQIIELNANPVNIRLLNVSRTRAKKLILASEIDKMFEKCSYFSYMIGRL
jgi:hypothetical protein